MNLLDRMAHSNGNPQRTIAALRLINQSLERELRERLHRLSAKTQANDSWLSMRLRLALNPAGSHQRERNKAADR
jgi:hypothetical protein